MADVALHPVAQLLLRRRTTGSVAGARDDGARVALVIEGGGMRGAISGGMAIALEELGLSDAFDDVYGTSAGALNAAWFASGVARDGVPGWANPEYRMAMVRRSNLLRRRPLVDSSYLVDVVYEQLTPLPFEEVLRRPIGVHPIATDASTGRAFDLAPLIRDVPTLKLALRASSALPLLAGRPVELGGMRWFDGGIAESVPFHTALAQGATHVLVLRSRRADEQETQEQGRTAALISRYLTRHSPELATAFLGRAARFVRDDAMLLDLERDTAALPQLLSVRPPLGTPSVGRIERDDARVVAGLEAGVAAMRAALGAPALRPSSARAR